MPSKFAHLHTHSHYSLLEALPQVDELVKHAKKLGMGALALTDNGNMFGTIEFVQECQKAEIKPIIGMDAYVAIDTLQEKRHRIDNRSHRMVLLAENMVGYKNLMQLASVGYLEGFYYRPRIDRVVLKERGVGLIGIMGGRSDVVSFLVDGDEEKASARLEEYLGIFGKDRLFLELSHQPDVPAQEANNATIAAFAKKHGVGIVGTRNIYYLEPDEAEGRRLLLCIKDNRTMEEYDRSGEPEPDFSMSTEAELREAFKEYPEALANVEKIVERCDVKLELGKWNFPIFEIPDGLTADAYLRKISFEGLAKLLKREPNDVESKRLDYELDIIKVKGYATYFLVVADYTNWARAQGIITTTRGSAAGSLMAFSIGITTVNPLDFMLPFERFLNPLRPSAPDIDMDFADNRRGEVLEYVKKKYGIDRVAQICTFGTMAARGSVRDVGRALAYPLEFVDKLSKMVPMGAQGFPMTIDRALDKEAPELRALYDTDPRVKRLFDLAKLVEGNARQCSVHAAGVVISDKPLIEYTPLQREAGGEAIITQYDMNAVEAAGVLKMDFLGIRNLSILGNAIDLVKRTKNVDIDLYHMPLDDKKTYEMLARGETMGLFQLNGDGMTKWLMQLKPSNIFDIMAMVALYRPGPMDVIPDFIKRKNGTAAITYMDPRMKDYLQASYGLLVYQDDILLTAINIAGYDWLEADKLRKAMGKKIPAEMAAQEEKFKKGCIKNGLVQSKADHLWDLFTPFAAYGFGKAHAASYAIVAYQTAYMKAHFPAEYMTALMTAESGDLDQVAEAVRECKAMGIEVLAPDVNESESMFTYIDDSHIRFGLGAIKNLGDDTIRSVVEERQANGTFESLEDFGARVTGKAFNKKSLEALAKSGAFGTLAERKSVLDNLELLVAYNKNAHAERASGQTNIFAFAVPGDAAPRRTLMLKTVPPADLREILAWEKDLLGLYVSAHPFAEFEKEFEGLLEAIPAALAKAHKEQVRVGGNLKTVKQITTKKGEPMLFVQLEDTKGECEVIVFPRTFKENGTVWVEGTNVAVTGRVDFKDDERKIIADRGWLLNDDTKEMYKKHFRGEHVTTDDIINPKRSPAYAEASAGKEVQVHIPAKLPPATVAALKAAFAKYPGPHKLSLVVKDGEKEQRLETSFRFDPTPDAIRTIEQIIGFGNVKVLQVA